MIRSILDAFASEVEALQSFESEVGSAPDLLACVGNAIPFFAISWGQQRVSSGLAGVLMAVMPLTTLLLAHFFVPGERLIPKTLMGFLVAVAGLIVLSGPDALLELTLLRADTSINYIGYVEGRGVFNGVADVVITDAVVGNVMLKLAEGLSAGIFKSIAREVQEIDPDLATSFSIVGRCSWIYWQALLLTAWQ